MQRSGLHCGKDGVKMRKIDWHSLWHKLTDNIGLKLIALIFSIFLWFFVVNIDDPIKSRVFSDIPLTIQNKEIVINEGKKFKNDDDFDSVRVVVHARRSILNKLTAEDITANVDLRMRDTSTGIVPIVAVVNGYEENLDVTTETNPNNVRIKVEDSTSKSFPISVMTVNKQRDGYELGEMTTNPERIQISGAKSIIEDIQRVVAKIDVNGKSEDCVLDAELIIFDGNGNVMDQSGLENNLGDKGVSVNVQILPSKNVKLKFNVSGIPAEGYRFTSISSEPEIVDVYGTKETLSELAYIEIPATEINLDGAEGRKEFTIDISPYIPEGVHLVEETANNVVVTVMVEKEGTRTLLLPFGAVRITNLNEKLSASVEKVGNLEVKFEGKDELLQKLNIQNAASIDLRGYNVPGTYEVPVNIEVNSDVTLMETPMITITLSDKKEETKTTEE